MDLHQRRIHIELCANPGFAEKAIEIKTAMDKYTGLKSHQYEIAPGEFNTVTVSLIENGYMETLIKRKGTRYWT